MEIVYIALAVMVLALLYEMVIRPVQEQKKIITFLEQFSSFHLTVEKNTLYDYALEDSNLLILIKVVSIPTHSCVTINSKDTWSLTWGGNPVHPGRAYPKQRYMNELKLFLKKEFVFEKRTLKLVLLYPKTEKILRYLNESELDIITAQNTVHGYKVTTVEWMVRDFPTLIKEETK